MNSEKLPARNLEWKMISQCNYNCWYCLEKGDRLCPPPGGKDIDKYADAILSNLKEPWVVQITGGEPFIEPEFMIGLSKRLVENGHWLKVFTNLSADLSDYTRFFETTGRQLYKLKASFHMDEVSFNEFLEKALAINRLLSGKSKFKIFSVILPGMEKIRKLKTYSDIFRENGLVFDVIHMIDPLTKEFYRYTNEERELINEYFGECSNEISLITTGHNCRSGYSYFAITQDFDAWSCWDAKFKNDKANYYGNLLGEFKFPYKRQICPYGVCNYPNGIEDKV